ncbi:tyrosine-type recombinase/integrase [Actinomadura litoris]|uniref:tyrosine-type recombinase/integrase n=1 Tax=Actinomadura litoris TaxID=2678616 RepID=UPI001FA6AAAF|nr:tyrosine-type recombinase/integrase [Actinomadura litoris]
MKPVKKCWCRDESGKLLHTRCPKLKKRGHGKWYGRYEAPPAPDGKRRQPELGPFDTEKECKEALNAAATHTQRTGRVRDRKTTLGELLETRYAQRIEDAKSGALAKTTMEAEREAIDLYLKPGLGHLKFVELRDSDIMDLYAAMRLINRPDAEVPSKLDELMRRLTQARALRNSTSGRAYSTRPLGERRIRRIHAVLTGALNHAVKVTKSLDTSPAVGLFPRKRSSIRASEKPLLWTDERVERWQETGKVPGKVMVWAPKHAGVFLDFIAEERLYPLYHLAAYWGPRRGEIVGLEKQDFSVPRRRFHVRHAQPDDELDEVKSGDSNRYVIFDDLTADVMTTWFEGQAAEREAWGDAYIDSGRVFTYEDGRPLRPELLSDWFARQVEKYNTFQRRHFEDGWDADRIARRHRTSVERVQIALAGPPLPPVRFHDLRHGAATMAAAAGVAMKVISDNLGHSSESFTADVYAVVAEELATAAARKIGEFVPRRSTRSGPDQDPVVQDPVVHSGAAWDTALPLV